jgi:hypothetical protein
MIDDHWSIHTFWQSNTHRYNSHGRLAIHPNYTFILSVVKSTSLLAQPTMELNAEIDLIVKEEQ